MSIQILHLLACAAVVFATVLVSRSAQAASDEANPLASQASGAVSVADLLPEGFADDGSVGYMPQVQQALDTAARTGGMVIFPPCILLLDDPAGFRVASGMTLVMHGTRFLFAEGLAEDGQAFRGESIHDVRFVGGSVTGKRDAWAQGVNVAGIRIYGECSGIRISDMRFEDLSSNAIGLFGDEQRRIRDVWVRDVSVRNCCNYYGDYLSDNPGPAEGSDRKDQGGVAFYHVDNWVVDGCDFQGSQSDGTHFFHSHHGRFVNSRVLTSNMGGYFLEGCRHVLAANNLISENGSRGVTIERDSAFCTLRGNVIERSGREGLWAPDVMAIMVADCIFRENGRKDDTDRDCEIRTDNGDRYETQTRDVRVSGNLFYTSAHQTAAVMITDGVRDSVVRDNSFRGAVENQHLMLSDSAQATCLAEANDIVEDGTGE
ncbi:MAG: right-handed parallel beta-helix repeat-containing protein [bacterium]|nr:right-handed parallel beta-helix repeat-containing protein [bacterium]